MKSAFSSPGTPKMYSTPSFSMHLTNRSDAFIVIPIIYLVLLLIIVMACQYENAVADKFNSRFSQDGN